LFVAIWDLCVLEAENGAGAIAVADAHPGRVDVLVTDVVMPRMGGSELARILRARQPALKVLFVSSYSDDVLIDRGEQRAGGAFLPKPHTSNSLLERVRRLLEAHS
jgi:CheY-like chemotaxis protein